MIYHVLPGDAQVEAFRESGIEGEMLVCREGLIEGDISGDSLDEFFINRASFMNESYDEDPANYNAKVASQFRRLFDVSDSDEVNLWFEYELFCAVNMWFCLDLLSKSGADIYRVAPAHLDPKDRWNGFGGANSDDLQRCLKERRKLTSDDIRLGSDLWRAFRNNSGGELLKLSANSTPAFPYLDEVGKAAAAKDTQPAAIVSEIEREGINNFNEIFIEFRRRAGVYGYGDSQVKHLMESRL
jgi:hypothetical protein